MKKEIGEYKDGNAGRDKVRGSSRRISPRNFRTFSSLKDPVYRIYYGGLLAEMASMNMQMMARSLLLYRLTGSAAMLGIMNLAHALPMLFLAVFGGVLADRIQKKYIMFAGQASSSVVTLGTALALSLGYLSAERPGSWWILMITSLLQGTIMGLAMPSRQAIIREIVSQEQLMNAVALNTLGMNIFRFLSPALAGFLIDALGFEAVYFWMTGMHLISAGFIAFLPRTGTITSHGGDALADIREGFRYIRRETTILIILAFTLFAVILSMPYMALMPIFTDDILKVGAKGMGILQSVSGAGAMFGSLALASLPNKKRGMMLLVSGLVLGLALMGFAFSRWWFLSLALIIFIGLGQTGRMSLSNSLLQYYTPDEYRGRVLSIYLMEFGLASFGTFVAGLLSEALGVQWAIGGFAAVLVFLSILALTFVSRLRKLD